MNVSVAIFHNNVGGALRSSGRAKIAAPRGRLSASRMNRQRKSATTTYQPDSPAWDRTKGAENNESHQSQEWAAEDKRFTGSSLKLIRVIRGFPLVYLAI